MQSLVIQSIPSMCLFLLKSHNNTHQILAIHEKNSTLCPIGGTGLSVVCAAKMDDLRQGIFEQPGVNVTVFADIYSGGHQTGVTIIQHGKRVAANGDIRLEISPGQWSPMPKGGSQTIDKERLLVS